MSRARVVAVSVGPVCALAGVPAQESAYAKARVRGPVRVTALGLEGDAQGNRAVHGGLDRAVLAYAAAHYLAWRAELGGHAPPFGGFAENLTVDGLDEGTVCIGDRYRIGTAVLEVSVPRKPCGTISRATGVGGLTERVDETGRWGWLHRVVTEGAVAEGDAVERVARPHAEWTVTRAADVMERIRRHEPGAVADARALSLVVPLTEGWRRKLAERADAADAGARHTS